jgi:predicted unusual protein kinase regulating ubiquinone biosynthesis (AarF/ABC1/UbiB family)
MSYINEYGMIHTDLHGKNISVLDGRLIAHDWGRAFISKNKDDYNINVLYTLENIKVFETRAETKYVLPIMTNTGYFNNVIDPINQKEKVDSVLKRSWDTLALIGISEKYEIITKESVNKFLTAFVELVKRGPVDENFSNNLRKIIPIAFGQMRGGAKLSQTNRFCKCIKKVKRTFRNEKGPIAVCVKSVLWKQGRTLKRFKCGRNARVITQRRK